MPLTLSNGENIGTRDFLQREFEIVNEFPPVQNAKDDPRRNEEKQDAQMAWFAIFAEPFGVLCKELGYPVDVVEYYVKVFQRQIAQDLELFKWAKGYYVEHHKIGWEEAAKAVLEASKEKNDDIRQEVRSKMGEVLGYKITLVFPIVPTAEAPEERPPIERVLFIPADGRLPPKQAA